MSKQQALDILQKQIDAYHRGGEWAPRDHFGRALEIAVDALREDIDGGTK